MTFWDDWANRVRHVGRRFRFDQELEEEIRFHIDTRVEELQRSGLSSDEARTQARREFGSVIRTREESREAWRFGWLEDLAADLRYGSRAFRRSPGFTLTAVLSLGLGIGASSAIFGALDAALWKPLPVADPGRLVELSLTRSDGRTDVPLVAADSLETGVYELSFYAADYFHRLGVTQPATPFLGVIVIRVGIADPSGNYHVPLLLSPFAYSTYRGS